MLCEVFAIVVGVLPEGPWPPLTRGLDFCEAKRLGERNENYSILSLRQKSSIFATSLVRGRQGAAARRPLNLQLFPIQRRIHQIVSLVPQLQREERRVGLVDAL